MARYIDETDVYKLVEPRGVAKVHCSQIDELPRADVVSKSEYDELKKTLDATIAGQETLQKALAKAKTETAREIFEEVKKLVYNFNDEYSTMFVLDGEEFVELIKSYVGTIEVDRDLVERAIDKVILNCFDTRNATITVENDIFEMLKYPEKYVTPEAQLLIMTLPDEVSAGKVLRIGIVYDEDAESYSIYTEDDLGMDFTNPCKDENLVDTFVRVLNANLKRKI